MLETFKDHPVLVLAKFTQEERKKRFFAGSESFYVHAQFEEFTFELVG